MSWSTTTAPTQVLTLFLTTFYKLFTFLSAPTFILSECAIELGTPIHNNNNSSNDEFRAYICHSLHRSYVVRAVTTTNYDKCTLTVKSKMLYTSWLPSLNWFVPVWILLFCQMAQLQMDEMERSKGIKINGAAYGLDLDHEADEPIEANQGNITVQMGTDVILNCQFDQLGDKVVSWMKDENGILKLLTYGLATYSSDSRQSLFFEAPNKWQLRLKSVQSSDAGSYQCQMSTHPPTIFHYTINVLSPTVEIVDDGLKPLKDKMFKTGSTLELRCIVGYLGLDNTSQHVSWYHANRLLNNDTFRGGISVKSWIPKDYVHSKLSKLYVANVNRNDSGWYTCSMGRSGNATVFVSVLHGEIPAAMQHSDASPTNCPILFAITVATISVGALISGCFSLEAQVL